MQKKHQFFFLVLGVPTYGEGGGVDLVGTKDQIFPMSLFEGSPYSFRKKDGPTSACGLWRSPYHQQARCHRHALCYEILQEDRLQKK